jgi:hypothetical protein
MFTARAHVPIHRAVRRIPGPFAVKMVIRRQHHLGIISAWEARISLGGGCRSAPRTAPTCWARGYIVFHEVFNGDDIVCREIVVNTGPHLTSRAFDLSCEVTTEAWGLS